jgi:peptidoglycan/LPS O-acetylase OafA/YrhL
LLSLGSRGVDLFFVLSGYLITGILFDSKGESRFFRNFYIRRVLRILPLYYLSLVLFLLIVPRFLTSEQFPIKYAQEDQMWLWLHAANISFLLRGGWSLGRLDHFWSLAIEEHFYFVWPLVIFLFSRRTAMWICVLGFLASPLARIAWLASGGSDIAIETLTIFRLDGLLAGAWLALASRGPGGIDAIARPSRWAVLPLAVALAGLFILQKRLALIPEAVWALFFTATMAILLASNATSRLKQFFELRGLRTLGKYSYAMYVFQNPLVPLVALVVTSNQIEAWCGSMLVGRIVYGVMMAVITLVTALLSWNLFEKHFLALKDKFAPRPEAA